VKWSTRINASPNPQTDYKELKNMFKNFLKDETGAELAEYAVGVALLVAIGVVVYQVLGDAIFTSNTGTGSVIENASFTPST
jgi:Flp pilus assembly pilin Flp